MPNNANGPIKQAQTRRIDEIVIGRRHRRDMGDIAGLATSIRDVGLLHPIVVGPDRRLIAGERRLRAAELLGWAEIAVNVVDLDSVARGEFAENRHRKNYTPSELVAIGQEVERLERESAKARMTLGKISTGSQPGKARDKIAARLGVSGRSYEKAKAVVEAAEAEPGNFGALLEAMDKSGRVHAPYKRLNVMRQVEQIRAEPPPLPGRGPYRVGVVDFPWPYEIDSDGSAARGVWPYPTMSVSAIRAFPIPTLLHAVSVLWVWATNYHLQLVPDLLSGWGFRWVTLLTWGKDHAGTGQRLRGQTEHCVLAARGEPVFSLAGQSTLLLAPAPPGGHSRKPPEFYDLVESLCPAPRYADVFSRHRHNDKWDCHGDEAPAPAERAAE